MWGPSYKAHTETNFASAAPKDPVTLRQVEATIQRRWGAAVEKSECCIIFMCSDPHFNGAVEDAQAARITYSWHWTAARCTQVING